MWPTVALGVGGLNELRQSCLIVDWPHGIQHMGLLVDGSARVKRRPELTREGIISSLEKTIQEVRQNHRAQLTIRVAFDQVALLPLADYDLTHADAGPLDPEKKQQTLNESDRALVGALEEISLTRSLTYEELESLPVALAEASPLIHWQWLRHTAHVHTGSSWILFRYVLPEAFASDADYENARKALSLYIYDKRYPLFRQIEQERGESQQKIRNAVSARVFAQQVMMTENKTVECVGYSIVKPASPDIDDTNRHLFEWSDLNLIAYCGTLQMPVHGRSRCQLANDIVDFFFNPSRQKQNNVGYAWITDDPRSLPTLMGMLAHRAIRFPGQPQRFLLGRSQGKSISPSWVAPVGRVFLWLPDIKQHLDVGRYYNALCTYAGTNLPYSNTPELGVYIWCVVSALCRGDMALAEAFWETAKTTPLFHSLSQGNVEEHNARVWYHRAWTHYLMGPTSQHAALVVPFVLMHAMRARGIDPQLLQHGTERILRLVYGFLNQWVYRIDPFHVNAQLHEFSTSSEAATRYGYTLHTLTASELLDHCRRPASTSRCVVDLRDASFLAFTTLEDNFVACPGF